MIIVCLGFEFVVTCAFKGDRFKINVIDKMDNHTMNKTTSIVSFLSDSFILLPADMLSETALAWSLPTSY